MNNNYTKILKKIFIVKFLFYFLILLSIPINVFSQETDEWGATKESYGQFDRTGDVSVSGTQLTNAGFRLTKYKIQNRYNKKMKKQSLSAKERKVKRKKENGGTLSAKEERIYKRVEKKEKKQKKINEKFTDKMSAVDKTDSSAFALTAEEERVMKKSKQDSTEELTFSEKRTLKKVKQKIKKKEKSIEKDSVYKSYMNITPQDSLLLEKNKSDTSKLNRAEKRQFKSIKKKQRKIKKHKKKKKKHQLDSMGNTRTWTAIKLKKFRMPRLFKRNPQKRAMTKEQKKIERYKRRYKLSDKQQDSYNKGKSGAPLRPSQKMAYKKAVYKKWKLKKKIEKVYKDALLDIQDEKTKDRMKKNHKKTKKNYKKHTKRKRKKKFINFFRKKKFKGRSNRRE